MARIPQEFIDRVLERTDIVALIGARVALKKAGREHVARCPFHDEKTPSFTVSSAKQFYYCFGCGANGTAIGFLMAYDRLEFRAAVAVLAHEAGLELARDFGQRAAPGPSCDPLFEVVAAADRFYRRALRASDAAIGYLKRRGVSGETARRYGLGYAPDAWAELAGAIGDRRAAAARAGLIAERAAGGYYDRFRNRLMFPIRDIRGRTVAFGGRTLGDDNAKYLNSPETPLFHKADQLYGLFEARRTARDLDRLIVVEGYMDVLALAQYGFGNAVATLGTATTEAHLRTLFRHTSEVVFCFDGDRAGVNAARKALERSLPVMRGARRVRFLFLPESEDPDTLVRADNGQAHFQRALDGARPASAVLLDALTQSVDLDTPDGRAQMLEHARGYVNALPPEALRSELIEELARLARLPADDLRAMYAGRPPQAARAAATGADERAVRTTPVSRALCLLLADPRLANRVSEPNAVRNARARGAPVLAEAIEFFAANPNIAIAQWLERYREHRFFCRLQQIAALDPPGQAPERARDFVETIERLISHSASRASLRQRYDALVAQQARAPLPPAGARELQDVLQRLRSRHDDPGIGD